MATARLAARVEVASATVGGGIAACLRACPVPCNPALRPRGRNFGGQTPGTFAGYLGRA